MTTIAALPDKVTATLADDHQTGRVYQLRDERGYTHRADTIRITKHDAFHNGSWAAVRRTAYRITRLGPDGWHLLAEGDYPEYESTPPYGEAVVRAVSILYGMEDHG